MKKNNIIILAILVIFIIVVIITFNIALKNRKYVDNTLTIDNLTEIENKISEGKVIRITEFEEYKLDTTREEGELTIYLYNVNDKYRVEVIVREELVLSVRLINKVTEVSVDLMTQSLEEFLIND